MSQVMGGPAVEPAKKRGMRKVWVLLPILVLLCAVGAVMWGARDKAPDIPPPSAETVQSMVFACESAGEAKLQPLATTWSGNAKYELRDSGTEWTVTTDLKSATQTYDVTCVVQMPGAAVLSVSTRLR